MVEKALRAQSAWSGRCYAIPSCNKTDMELNTPFSSQIAGLSGLFLSLIAETVIRSQPFNGLYELL